MSTYIFTVSASNDGLIYGALATSYSASMHEQYTNMSDL